jgi:hypothetical protein
MRWLIVGTSMLVLISGIGAPSRPSPRAQQQNTSTGTPMVRSNTPVVAATLVTNFVAAPTPAGIAPQMIAVVRPLATGLPTKTNTSTLTLAWTPSDNQWKSFTLFSGHASGQWVSTNVFSTNAATATNFNSHVPWVFAVIQTDSNGQSSPLSPELWWNAASNGMVYSETGREYVGFVALSNWSYQIQGVLGTAMNVSGIYAARTTNSYGALALPGSGFYRLGRFTN